MVQLRFLQYAIFLFCLNIAVPQNACSQVFRDTVITGYLDQDSLILKGTVSIEGDLDLTGFRHWSVDSAALVSVSGLIISDSTSSLTITGEISLKGKTRIVFNNSFQHQDLDLGSLRILNLNRVESNQNNIDSDPFVLIRKFKSVRIHNLVLSDNLQVLSPASAGDPTVNGALKIDSSEVVRISGGLIINNRSSMAEAGLNISDIDTVYIKDILAFNNHAYQCIESQGTIYCSSSGSGALSVQNTDYVKAERIYASNDSSFQAVAFYCNSLILRNSLFLNSNTPIALDYWQEIKGHIVEHCSIQNNRSSIYYARGSVDFKNCIILGTPYAGIGGTLFTIEPFIEVGSNVTYENVLRNWQCENNCSGTTFMPLEEYSPGSQVSISHDSSYIRDSLLFIDNYAYVVGAAPALMSVPIDYFGNIRPFRSRVSLGAIEYSNLSSINETQLDSKIDLLIGPNPMKGTTLNYRLVGSFLEIDEIVVYDVMGKVISRPRIISNSGVIDFVTKPREGIIFVSCFFNDGTVVNTPVLVVDNI